MPHATTAAEPGLQAIILCGPGSSFPTFTTNPDEHPKALLPIANRPMLWYPLDFCYRAGVTNITIICPPSTEKAISSALNINPFLTSLPLPRPDLLAPEGLELDTGTAEILRLESVRNVITKDFMVLPCDLVCELSGDKLLQAWMVKAASLSDLIDSDDSDDPRSGGLGVWYPTKTGTPTKGEETDFIAVKSLAAEDLSFSVKGTAMSDVSKLVYSMPTDSLNDIIEEKSGLPIRHGLTRQHPRLKMLTTHRDAHIYILPHWILDLIKDNDRLDSIGEDVIGYWAKATWQAGLAEKLGLRTILDRRQKKTVPSQIAREDSSSPSEENTPLAMRPTVTSKNSDYPVSHSELVRRKLEPLPDSKNIVVPPILAYVQPSDPNAPLIRRVDTAQLLLNISLQLAKLPSIEDAGDSAASPFAHARKVIYPEGIQARTTVTRPDCLLADNVTVEQKVSIKETVIGLNCQIKEGAKLTQCLLMDGVVVGKNCKLQRCILGRRCEIGDGSTLVDCEVQENLFVDPQTEDKSNKLMSSSGLDVTDGEADEVYRELDDGVVEPGDVAVTG